MVNPEIITGGEDNQVEKEKGERGRNVRIRLKVVRHGERSPEGHLTDFGRKVTMEKAKSEIAELGNLDKIKAVGSNMGPKNEKGMARSMETSDIYADVYAGDKKDIQENSPKYRTRARSILNMLDAKHKVPFDWPEYYNSFLPDNYESLDDDEKSAAAYKAQGECLNRILTDSECDDSRRDIASRYAFFVDRYIRMVDKVKNNSNIMYTVGSHGGFMEPFLSECIKIVDEEGKMQRGFQDVKEIGGSFHPSEGFTIDITSDDEGNKKIEIIMDDSSRMKGKKIILDMDNLHGLVGEYKKNYIDEKNKEE